MFEYIINMPFPLKSKSTEFDNISTEIARYNFDLGLQIGDQIVLSDIHFGGWEDKPFSFRAVVVRKEKTIKPQRECDDLFIIDIYVELADKEELPRMRDVLIRLNPGKYEV
jgi:hypothetical protein